MTNKTILGIAAALIIFASGVLVYRSVATVATAQKPAKLRSFIAEGQTVVIRPDGDRKVISTFKSQFGESGQSLIETQSTATEKATNASYCVPGLGAFTVRGSSLQIRGECTRPTAKGLEGVLANSRNVSVRDDFYLGIPVKHTYREYVSDGKTYASEGWGNDEFLYKLITTHPDGVQTVFETLAIRFEPVSPDTFQPPNLPADFTWIENQLQKAKGSGNLSLAANQEQALARLKLAFAQR